ncbi:TetR/AcrR family transcriptional regulator [Brachybacterium subflavum]|uniref:TetR/AcrR family transcriptional regulator n=1 Tax=Brachybacterium subflavum TaxID=2585206 RepID=UPI0012661B68|nr:TetR family transcriptional regulator [Brachybacterium subflavum]
MDFQRARSEEQRERRRRAILDTAASMLEEMPVAQLSLNELSRRVGLAKSNVLRYFESREAILLELLDAELRAWIEELRGKVEPVAASARARGDQMARALAETMAERPVLCDLIASQAAVLERNISRDVALRHKRATAASAGELVDVIRVVLPELSDDEAYGVVVVTLLMASAAWPHSRPSDALQAAYDADPEVAASYLGFIDVVASTVAVHIAGTILRRAAAGDA